MSHDELPPDAESSRQSVEEQSEPETSIKDAPPARRRRPRKTDDAAQSKEDVESSTGEGKTAAARRRSKKAENAADVEDAAVSSSDGAAPNSSARRSRSARSKAGTQDGLNTLNEGSKPEISERIETSDNSLDKIEHAENPTVRTARPRRSRRKTLPSQPIVDLSADPQVMDAVETETVTVSLSSTEETIVSTGGVRTGGKRNQGTEPSVLPVNEPASLPTEEAASIKSPSSRRSHRSRRSRRTIEPEEEAAAVSIRALADKMPDPIPEPVIDLDVGAHLIPGRDGESPAIVINGRPYPPTLFFGNYTEGDAKSREHVLAEVHHAARSGIHLHSILIELPCPLPGSNDALNAIHARLLPILEADPEGFLIPRILFIPAPGWRRVNQEENVLYADGSTSDPSISSDRFWQECEKSLQKLISSFHAQEWGDRIAGYHLERGEWFYPSYLGFDRSKVNRDAFRVWLQERYMNNIVTLRAAWHNSELLFNTAEIPVLPLKPNLQRAFYETRKERCILDFFEFTSESVARRLASLARTVKRACSYNALVSVCYGYTLEFGHGFSGHLALASILEEPAIDLICGPPSYRDRKPGGAASLPAPVHSVLLHGKLWISEDDTKTHLAPIVHDPEDYNSRLSDRFQTEQAQMRAVGRALAWNTGIGWMDLWGEGWLDAPALWERIGKFVSLSAEVARSPSRPEVVAIIDEKSLIHIQRSELFFRNFTGNMRETLQRAGVEFGFYLQSDLTHPSFPTDARLYLFLTPFRLSTLQREAIKEKLQNGGKTVVWLYAPGVCEEKPGPGNPVEETSFDVVGIRIRPQPWNSEIGSQIILPNHPVTELLRGREFGTKERLNPSFYIDDPEAQILAEYRGSGLPSMGVKMHAGWQSVFIGDPIMPVELLRGLCRLGGVHLWTTSGEDVVDMGNGWISIHAARDGQRTIRLPSPAALYDITGRKLIASLTRDHTFSVRAGSTTLFYTGSLQEMEYMGLISAEKALSLPDMIIPQIEPRSHAPAASVINSSAKESDLETLRAVLSLSLDDLGLASSSTMEETLQAENNNALPLEAAEHPVSVIKRRRRRGGRGRGKRRVEGTETETNNEGEKQFSIEESS